MRASSLGWKKDWKEYQRLEQIAVLPAIWKSRWQNWGTQLLDWLTGDHSTIKIHRTLVDGQIVYNAHDRETNRDLHHANEAALRQWLEQRYYS